MRIVWVALAGAAPFNANFIHDTDNMPIPRIGEAVVEGSQAYRVRDVLWNYSNNYVSILVELSSKP